MSPSSPTRAPVTGSSTQAPSTMPAPTYPSTLRRDSCACGAPRVADRPVQQVLEPAREASRVLGRGEQERIGLRDRAAPVDHRRGREIRIQIGVEGREVGHSLEESGVNRVGRETNGGTKGGGVGRAVPQAPGDQEDPRTIAHPSCNIADDRTIPAFHAEARTEGQGRAVDLRHGRG